MANKQFTRADRVAQQIQRDLATVIRAELNHPHASLITVTDVEVSRDYSHAKVFYTFLGDASHRPEIAHLLERAKGFLQHGLHQLAGQPGALASCNEAGQRQRPVRTN